MTAVWAIVLVASVVVAAVGVGLRLRWLLGRPCRPERSRVAGSPGRGVLYAFTWGMMPWAKESTRIHLLAYLRGIVFHAGIAAGFLGLALSPWAPGMPAAVRWFIIAGTLIGALAGWAGLAARLVEHNLRAVSTPDDLLSVALVSAFLTTAAAAWWDPRWSAAFFVAGAATLIAIPLTKIRHCIYFFLSRYFFGLFYGRRGVIGGIQHE